MVCKEDSEENVNFVNDRISVLIAEYNIWYKECVGTLNQLNKNAVLPQCIKHLYPNTSIFF